MAKGYSIMPTDINMSVNLKKEKSMEKGLSITLTGTKVLHMTMIYLLNKI